MHSLALVRADKRARKGGPKESEMGILQASAVFADLYKSHYNFGAGEHHKTSNVAVVGSSNTLALPCVYSL